MGRGLAAARRIGRWAPGALLLMTMARLLAGCAYSAFQGPYGTEPAAVARGAALAEQDCGACHGLGPAGASGFPGAPPFRVMRFDYNAISYARATSQWHLGMTGMPPAELSLDEVGYIGAYVRSLQRPRERR